MPIRISLKTAKAHRAGLSPVSRASPQTHRRAPEGIWRTPVTSIPIKRNTTANLHSSMVTKLCGVTGIFLKDEQSLPEARLVAVDCGMPLAGDTVMPKTITMRVKYTPQLTRTEMARNCKAEQRWVCHMTATNSHVHVWGNFTANRSEPLRLSAEQSNTETPACGYAVESEPHSYQSVAASQVATN